MMKRLYCEECMVEREFKRVEIKEKVTIKDETFDVIHEYDKCEHCGELFEPFENIDKNIEKDYSIYRDKKGYLQPEKIKKIREKYGFSVRQFAELLGIGYSTLSNIENGALHTKYQDVLFKLVASPQAFKNLITNSNDPNSFELDKLTENHIKKLGNYDNQNNKPKYEYKKLSKRENKYKVNLDNDLSKKPSKSIYQKERDNGWTKIGSDLILQK